MKRLVSMLLPLGLVAATAHASGPTIGPDNAQGFIGKDAVVCGTVDSARYNENSDGQPTFMHFGGAFPRHKFSVRVDGAHRSKFTPPPEEMIGKMICVGGRIGRAAGNRPEITIESPGSMQVM